MNGLNQRQRAAIPYVRAWLFFIALLVFCMIIVGGATRLTDSGLSITEWQPLLGAIPPLSEADWHTAFEKYKRIPEYQTVNKWMGLEDFKFIYWWEWSHRFLGRFIGIAFLLPLLFFALSRRLAARTWKRLAAIFALGGLQGALGWYMVASGLVDRVDVSQYRLAAHLTLAALIFGVVLWVAMGLRQDRRRPASGTEWLAVLFTVLVLAQVAAGGFVAGLDAGMGYNTWPLIDGKFIPDGLAVMEPYWRNTFENALAVQFNHRMLAYLVVILAAALAMADRSPSAGLVLVAIVLQSALGIWTLLWQVPLWLGLAHQGGAMIVFAAALWHLHVRLSRSPAEDRQ